MVRSVGLLDHHGQVVAQLRAAADLLHQEVRVHDDHAQGVVHLVGDAGGQLAHARELLGLDERLLRAGQLLVGMGQFADGAAELLDAVGQAHRRFGQARVDRAGQVAAGRVAARAAVQLVARVGLADVPEQPRQLIGRRHGHAQVEGRVRAHEIEAGPSAVIALPRRRVDRGDAMTHELADPGAPAEVRQVRAHAGAHRAALAEQELEQPRLHDAGFGFLDRLRELGRALAHHHVPRHEVFLDARHLQHAAADGKQAAAARVGRVEIAGGDRVEIDAPRRHHLAQFGEGQRLVDLAVQVGRHRLALLGDARPDEHDADRVAAHRPEQARHRDHRRDHRRERAGQVGVIAAHVADDGRARRGDPQPVGVFRHEPLVLVRHQLGAERDLVDGGEPHRPQGAHHLRVLVADELGREARRENGRHRRRAREERLHRLDGREDPLRVLRAHLEADAAADAPLGQHLRLVIGDPDRLCRALAHALVAHAAAFADGRHERFLRQWRHAGLTTPGLKTPGSISARRIARSGGSFASYMTGARRS
ncbi:MAG: hypothetical protein MUE61_17630 [Vicinamibacterales bacterium]|nr:hypothetical protein [Vicinamibacterales bacterium]